MSALFGSPLFVVLFFGVTIFVLSYLNSERIINFLYKRTLGQREDLFKLLDKMYVDADRRKISVTIVLLTFGLGFAVFLAAWPNIAFGALLGIVIALAGWAAPKTVLQGLWERRCNRIVNQMVDGMTIMANGVKSGLSVTQSMERVIENIAGPLAQEFTLVLNQIRLGRSVEEALVDFGDRIPRPDVQMFVTGVNILKETGGNLAEILDNLSQVIRAMQSLHLKVRALAAEGKMSAKILTALPIGVVAFIMFTQPGFYTSKMGDPLFWPAVAFLVVIFLIGQYMINRMVNFKY